MHEKRLVSRLHRYWDYLAKKSIYDLPIYDYFDEAVISDLQAFVAVFNVEEASDAERKSLYYYSLGNRLLSNFNTNPIGKELDSRISKLPGGEIVLEASNLILSEEFGSPFLKEGEVTTEDKRIIKYRNIAMPFTNSLNDGITEVVVGFSWGVFDN